MRAGEGVDALVDVSERQGRDVDVVGGKVDGAGASGAVCSEVAVRQHRACTAARGRLTPVPAAEGGSGKGKRLPPPGAHASGLAHAPTGLPGPSCMWSASERGSPRRTSRPSLGVCWLMYLDAGARVRAFQARAALDPPKLLAWAPTAPWVATSGR